VTIYDVIFAFLSYVIAIYLMFSVYNYGASTSFLLSEYYTTISLKSHLYSFYLSPVPSNEQLEFNCINKKTYYLDLKQNKMIIPTLLYYFCNPKIELIIPGSKYSNQCFINTESIGKIITDQVNKVFKDFSYYNVTIVCKNTGKKLVVSNGESKKYITIKQDYKYYTIYVSVWK